MVLGARHRHIQQAAFFFDFSCVAGGHVRRDATVDCVQHVHRVPFLALGRMNRREDQVVLVAQRWARFVARGLGRVEREIGQKRHPVGETRRQPNELPQVALANGRVVVAAPQMRQVPVDDALQFGRPRSGALPQRLQQRARGGPVGGRRGRGAERVERIGGRLCMADGREQALRARDADARHQLSDAKPGHPAARVFGPAQHRHHVFHVRRFEKLQTAELDERNVATRQLELECGAVVRGAKEHRLALECDALLAVAQHLVGHPLRLRGIVAYRHERRFRGGGCVAPQQLAEALGGERDDAVGGVENGLRRTVVARERDDARGRREERGEVEDVAHLGGAKRVDRLRVVADHREPAAVGPQRQQDRGLQAVRVLVLVDEHVVEARRHMVREAPVFHHLRPVEQQVVVVEHALVELGGGVVAKQRPQLGLAGRAPRVDAVQHVGQRRLAVEHTRVDRQAGGLRREALRRLGEFQLVPHQAHQVFGIGAVLNGEVLGQADLRRVLAQQPRADAVKRARPGQPRCGLNRAETERAVQGDADAALHVARRAAREREQQDALRVDPGEHEARHPRRQRFGFARTGAGDHEQRPRRMGQCVPPGACLEAVLDGAALRLVQLGERVERRLGRLGRRGGTARIGSGNGDGHGSEGRHGRTVRCRLWFHPAF